MAVAAFKAARAAIDADSNQGMKRRVA